MVDERMLTFPEAAPRHDFTRMVVLFSGKDGENTVPCAISHEALTDHFDDGDREPAKVFQANRGRIERDARRKYLAGWLEPDGSVLIETEDLW